MESQRKHLKNVFTLQLVIMFHIVVKSFFVTYIMIELKVIVNMFIISFFSNLTERVSLPKFQSVTVL